MGKIQDVTLALRPQRSLVQGRLGYLDLCVLSPQEAQAKTLAASRQATEAGAEFTVMARVRTPSAVSRSSGAVRGGTHQGLATAPCRLYFGLSLPHIGATQSYGACHACRAPPGAPSVP